MVWTNFLIENGVLWLGGKSLVDMLINYAIIPFLWLISALIRKNIFNDWLGLDFSLWGGAIGGILVYITTLTIANLVWGVNALKWGLLAGLISMFIIGWLIGDRFGDGQAEGGGDYSDD